MHLLAMHSSAHPYILIFTNILLSNNSKVYTISQIVTAALEKALKWFSPTTGRNHEPAKAVMSGTTPKVTGGPGSELIDRSH